ncbi:gamma-glutamylcyclotransferase [Bradyrhizobium algeriense]|uniref:gamma-glutamylcyclotransferase n=1 Tax=Bradyrhizobium algeriense TaxID=634784 RepID=UPI000D347DB6|nr:gamma-glutamylcyclotransferase [Bradyrhizobium algeriense]
MPTTLREMALTLDLVARTTRVVEDAGPSPGAVYMTDEDYDAAIGNVLAHAPPSDVWLFGYGSLLWKPVCEFSESRIATVRGWHRAFCYRVARFRGTRDKPGLMLALDRGGSCKGMIFKLPPDQVSASLNALFRREMMVKPAANVPRWMTAETDEGPIRALSIVVNRESPHYSGTLALEEAANILASAAGHWGSCAEYLRETVFRLEELGIHDESLWRLQALVAERLQVTLSSENSN